MSKYKTFIWGVLIGSMLAGGIGFAADHVTISVGFPDIEYWIDGKPIAGIEDEANQGAENPDYHPTTISYHGINYVPVRWLANHMNKQVDWDAGAGRVEMNTMESVAYEQLNANELGGEIERWVDRSLDKAMTQVREFNKDTYLLVTRGKMGTGGYEVSVTDVVRTKDEVLVKVQFTNPGKGMLATQVYTYPYVLLRIPGVNYRSVRFVEVGGHQTHNLTGYDFLPPIYRDTENMILFRPGLREGVWQLEGALRTFEGLAVYTLKDANGRVIQEHTIQADGGAPSWAKYLVTIEAARLEVGMSIELHTVSPKGESADEVISIPVESLQAYAK